MLPSLATPQKREPTQTTCKRISASACDGVAALGQIRCGCTEARLISAAAGEGVGTSAEGAHASSGRGAGVGYIGPRAGEGIDIHGNRGKVYATVRVLDHEVGDLFPAECQRGNIQFPAVTSSLTNSLFPSLQKKLIERR